jgi:hypothetical protein
MAYVSKSLVVPMILVYYICSAKKIDKLFVFGFLFAFCGNILLFNTSEFFFVLSMGCALLFLLIHMVLIANLIGTIKMVEFLKMSIPFMIILILLVYLIFHNKKQINSVFYVFGSVVAIYIAFSLYLFRLKKNNASLLNLIGVAFFLLFSITRGIEETTGVKGIYSVLAIFFYPSFLFFITKAYADIHKDL